MAPAGGTPVAEAAGVSRTLVATATLLCFLAGACAGPRPWPAHPVSIIDSAFAGHAKVTTIDVLPLDLQLWAESGYELDVDDVRRGAENSIMNVAIEALTSSSYAVGAMIDWDGDYRGGNALSKNDVMATVGALAHYGAATQAHPGQLPTPFLPVRLGEKTGADATLYVGGWGYLARHRESTGDQIAKGIFIGLVVVAVIGLVVLALSASSKKSHGHDHGPTPSGGRDGGSHHTFSASRGSEHVHGARLAAGLVDAFGRVALDVAVSSKDWGSDPALPHNGDEQQVYLEMTLVDNHTGVALWHAHQLFPADAASDEDLTRAAQTIFEQLPKRSAEPVTAAR